MSHRTTSIGLVLVVLALSLSLLGGCTPLQPRTAPPGTQIDRTGDGVYHTVRKGETLWRISRTYGVALAELVEANDLESYTIRVGQRIFVPGATSGRRVPEPPDHEPGPIETPLDWPLAGRGRGSVTSGFGPRVDPVTGGEVFHKGIDIDGAREERVLAAAGGEVVFSGGMHGYGIVVMVDHGDRLITVYAHLSRAIVKLEDRVAKGQTIGYVGTSGRTTGAHLHFEVRSRGIAVDPLEYLP
ncbi:MAG: peptidoglycan DD-metalloendopeptidase family protein [Candidatus Eisenbacteria bacterium]|nr:peptidoglycan DD-metalloendopeptidase family protein [Candidatus Eisenbacteria bacterium]